MIVKVDISEVTAITKRANEVFEEMPRAVLSFIQEGAETLVASDPYQDRTTNLRNSTEAQIFDDSVDSWEFDLAMDQPYASYVRDKGFSFIDDVADEVSDRIDEFVSEDMVSDIGS